MMQPAALPDAQHTPHDADYRLLLAGAIDAALARRIIARAGARDGSRQILLALDDADAVSGLLDYGRNVDGLAITVVPGAGIDIDPATWLGELDIDALDGVVCSYERFDAGWVDELSVDRWIEGRRVNARAAWLLARAAVPLLAPRGGSLVAFTSRAAHETVPGGGAFGASKVLEAMMLRNVAVESFPRGVRVNLLRTSPNAAPLGQRESEDQVADAVAFLLSAAAAGINAAVLPVDAGTATAGSTMAQFGLSPRPRPAAIAVETHTRTRAIITGGAGQIGAESAVALHRQAIADGRNGASVLLADYNADRLSAVTDRLGMMGIVVETIVADLASADVPAMLVDRAVASFGGLDVVHSNAALGLVDTALDADIDTYERIVSINLDATWRFAVAAAPHLARSAGCLIATSSIASLNANGRAPLYAASKAALTMFVAQLAIEWAGRGIRANVVCPGSIDTPMNQLSALAAEERDRIASTFPTGRMGSAAEIGAAVAFLASRDASYVTGQNLVVDGGLASVLR